MLATGQTLREADALADVLKAVSGLRAPGFELDGLVVFGVTERS